MADLLIGVIIPGAGSEAFHEPEIDKREDGRRYVSGLVRDRYDSPPFTMNVPVSCIRWCRPTACIVPDGFWQRP